jgi:SAM-dependent methyltransferase
MIIRFFFFALLFLISVPCYSVIKSQRKKKQQPVMAPINAQNIIDEIYKKNNIEGFNICETERNYIDKCGGNPTYGEITFNGLSTLIKKLQLTNKDVFYDLGCGVGKVCMQVVLTTPAQAIGIELSHTRAIKAEQARQELIKSGILKDKNRLKFVEDNITNTNFKDATVIFLCSTCFSADLMKQLTEKMAKLKKGLRVLTLKELTYNENFKLIESFTIPMTWSETSPVYWYELIKK